MRENTLILPESVSETVSLSSQACYTERSDISYVDFVTMKRFNEEVKFAPCLTPIAYQDTVICYQNSSRKRFKSHVIYENRIKPRTFSDTLTVFPKRPVKRFVTFVDYHIDECRRWFKTTMEFKARTFTTRKIIKDSDGEADDQESDTDPDSDGDMVAKSTPSNSGPGASQIFLPRWNKQRELELDSNNLHHFMNGDIIFNGY